VTVEDPLRLLLRRCLPTRVRPSVPEDKTVVAVVVIIIIIVNIMTNIVRFPEQIISRMVERDGHIELIVLFPIVLVV
jgi:hypothetical protein